MDCKKFCNLRKASWAVAVFYAILTIFMIVITIAVLAVPKTDENWKELGKDQLKNNNNNYQITVQWIFWE